MEKEHCLLVNTPAGRQSLCVNGCQTLVAVGLLKKGISIDALLYMNCILEKRPNKHKVAPAGMPKAELRSPKSTNKLET